MIDILMTIGIMLILNGVTLYLSSCEKYTIFCETKTAYFVCVVGMMLTLNILIWKSVICFYK